MQESKPQLKKETWKDRLRFHWIGIRVIVYIVEIAVPIFIGAFCGDIWGAAAAVLNLVAWLYFGFKAHMSHGTLMLWLFAVVYVITVVLVEFAKVFHWKL